MCQVYEIKEEGHVTRNMIRSWLAHLIEKGNSARSVNRKLSALKTYFKYLLRLELIDSNPVSVSVSLRTPGRLPSFATIKEMERALKPSGEASFANQRDLLVIEIFYSTGIRLSELMQLKTSDIDSYSLSIKVTGKRNKQRIIPISQKLFNKINDYLSAREQIVVEGTFELIINDKGQMANRVFITKIVKNYLGKAGVTGKRSPHVLRHTFATHMLNEGADLNSIKELLGHSSLATTQVYTHTNVERLKLIYEHAHPWAQNKEES